MRTGRRYVWNAAALLPRPFCTLAFQETASFRCCATVAGGYPLIREENALKILRDAFSGIPADRRDCGFTRSHGDPGFIPVPIPPLGFRCQTIRHLPMFKGWRAFDSAQLHDRDLEARLTLIDVLRLPRDVRTRESRCRSHQRGVALTVVCTSRYQRGMSVHHTPLTNFNLMPTITHISS